MKIVRSKLLFTFLLIFIIGIIGFFIDNINPIFKSYDFKDINSEYTDSVIPSQGGDLEVLKQKFAKWKIDNDRPNSDKLYRSFKIKWWKYWNWYTYLNSPYYTEFEYLE